MASQNSPSASTTNPLTTESPTYLIPNLSNLNPLISIKLDRDNYLFWEDKMLSILQSQDLYHFVDPIVTPPPSHISDSTSNTSTENHVYSQWRKADHTLVTWLKSSLTDSIHATVVGLRTSREVWCSLETSFASHNVARVVHLQNTISTLRKDNLSITDYLHKTKITADSIASINRLVSDLDSVSSILRGLSPEYESFVTTIYIRSVLPTFSELHAFLLNHEARLDLLSQQQNYLPQSTVFIARTQSSRNNYQPRSSPNYRGGRGNQ
ncbi:hypothetical protein BVC80_7927g3 [Macleaya cordata]|uniref:Retrotransposon Copia-like N-terminal domain-containing protein n=1 Tax=Macleaya cordata TaxID=56857 RepID=A0A200Q0Z5_MACCD|nr:hypothetical protein BVC80_7927g3 [Macleaya cordata]